MDGSKENKSGLIDKLKIVRSHWYKLLPLIVAPVMAIIVASSMQSLGAIAVVIILLLIGLVTITFYAAIWGLEVLHLSLETKKLREQGMATEKLRSSLGQTEGRVRQLETEVLQWKKAAEEQKGTRIKAEKQLSDLSVGRVGELETVVKERDNLKAELGEARKLIENLMFAEEGENVLLATELTLQEGQDYVFTSLDLKRGPIEVFALSQQKFIFWLFDSENAEKYGRRAKKWEHEVTRLNVSFVRERTNIPRADYWVFVFEPVESDELQVKLKIRRVNEEA